MKSLQPVILCGGEGTRLWPLSRTLYPKQFIEVSEGRVLFADAVARCASLPEAVEPIVVCNTEYRFLVAEQLRKLGTSGRMVLEPFGRNTAPAAAVAALMEHGGDPVLLVMPADHSIADPEAFGRAVSLGCERAEQGRFVCFGVVPDHPHTGYGYIRKGGAVSEGVFGVDSFVEKPARETAEEYLASGQYLWNSGIFLFKASSYLDALAEHAPAILDSCRTAVANSYKDLDFIRLGEEDFGRCPSDSIDYAVMEKVNSIEVVPIDMAWRDLGSWKSLHDMHPRDAAGNSLLGDVVAEDTHNSYVRSSGRLVVTLGLDNATVVETQDAVFVAANDKLDNMKSVIRRLKAAKRPETEAHKVVYRPWGSFESISADDRFQVKRIIVKPGEVLSLQKHFHRAEHWVVVKGTAKIVNGDKEFLLGEDESTYIPLGNVHRLENPGKILLELIEVQTGSYLGEDDIVRLEDKYKR
ncbi:mannose-1-phosphate guanylyltransferase/mannose-6-phosphate isomerase [Pseudodesulfovibrio mercurii]|uniref:mannose-1-phosphate guanylyltransferase n=1 Tax=Pseudodesulfovibrio mercurii TaxID=641491 RepID=F0JCB1_9BACT|nr:mannose-1-phosphate guanylyltransferase/mannose-6-phosphate isomerase [Pseudodesulfovibrio mercurii]EGB14409.1 mannose-1-phosphate guanylyltransferase/mannose-6-phosphate isomerase [Pseudodesulfovibrio mercurii]